MNNTDKVKLFFICFIFICFGSFLVLLGMTPQTIEIKHSDYRTDVIISKKNIGFLSAKDASETITNVKQADVVSFKTRKKSKNHIERTEDVYGIALRTYDGQSKNILSFDSRRTQKEKLRDEINKAINNKLDYKYTDDEDNLKIIIIGLFFMFTPLIMTLIALYKGLEIKINGKIINPREQKNPDNKYKNINNTIIK